MLCYIPPFLGIQHFQQHNNQRVLQIVQQVDQQLRMLRTQTQCLLSLENKSHRNQHKQSFQAYLNHYKSQERFNI
ncbi:hypothetical protein HanXRQr2_Chr12g0550481 [Helianthus annuus]|uniref:Uncharacterized protein n=1 Tax=Helianthus annuus TaxID=4232 RepID=A0A9K3HI27_HELAN|nr:hypothetical protein HanXRQr2_Chr12g0550481 [Helianthus annuus]KAJ0863439.1 hypothetical protein HanPSC8_Chr12g0530031 [Helianthus annuus]